MNSSVSRILVIAVVLGGCAGGAGTQSGPRKDVVVQFTNMNIEPQTAQVAAGGNVAWTNMATEYGGVILFPESVVDSFTCTELRPLFTRTGDGLQSIPIAQDSENVALPCPLKPGSYDYQVNLFEAHGEGSMGVSMENPVRSLRGKIVVE